MRNNFFLLNYFWTLKKLLNRNRVDDTTISFRIKILSQKIEKNKFSSEIEKIRKNLKKNLPKNHFFVEILEGGKNKLDFQKKKKSVSLQNFSNTKKDVKFFLQIKNKDFFRKKIDPIEKFYKLKKKEMYIPPLDTETKLLSNFEMEPFLNYEKSITQNIMKCIRRTIFLGKKRLIEKTSGENNENVTKERLNDKLLPFKKKKELRFLLFLINEFFSDLEKFFYLESIQ